LRQVKQKTLVKKEKWVPNPESWVGVGAAGANWCSIPPVRKRDGTLHFADLPKGVANIKFSPNLSPAEVLQRGSFGGGYFRNIHSAVTGKTYRDVWKELPPCWIQGMDAKTQLASQTYRKSMNRYGVDCGAKVDPADTFGQNYWDMKSWIVAQDPYGWFMWYCRFYQGRRSRDDVRQIKRWAAFAGAKGRWKNNLVNKVARANARYDDDKISPVVRQSLQHWAYEITVEDVRKARKKLGLPVGLDTSEVGGQSKEKKRKGSVASGERQSKYQRIRR